MVHEDSDCQHIMPILMTSSCYVKMTPQDILSWDIHLLQLSRLHKDPSISIPPSCSLLRPTWDGPKKPATLTRWSNDISGFCSEGDFPVSAGQSTIADTIRLHVLCPQADWHMLMPDVLTIPNHQHIIQHTHSVAHHLWLISTSTCFGTEVPYSGSHYNKGI
jgi:hypothetical protein